MSVRAWIVTIVVVLLGVAIVESSWVSAAGLDVWHLADLESAVQVAQERSVELDEEVNLTHHRLFVKDDIVADLIADRCTFSNAVDRFQGLNRGAQELLDHLHSLYPHADDRELAARNLLEFVSVHPFSSTDRKTALLERLRAEFRTLFQTSERKPS